MDDGKRVRLNVSFWIDAQVVRHCAEKIHIEIFVPEKPLIVLGSSNDAEREVNVAEAERRGIAICKRAGGGGTVVLYPGCVVISLGMWVEKPFENNRYFAQVNQAVIGFLQGLTEKPVALTQRGISDLAVGDKKVGGTSLFRSRQYLLYQASLIFNLDLGLISGLLRHPSKEPDYRKGRAHQDFLAGLNNYFPAQTAQDFSLKLRQNSADFLAFLDPFACKPDSNTIPHLLKRFA